MLKKTLILETNSSANTIGLLSALNEKSIRSDDGFLAFKARAR